MTMNYGGDYISDSSGGKLAPSSSVMRNRIINGAMVIDQRNNGASVATTDGSFGVDRWQVYSTSSGKFTLQQNAGAVTPPVGFTNYQGCVSTAATSLASTDTYNIAQKIEGFNFADLNWGTANAKTVTLSAWVYSSLTGTFGGALSNAALNRSYPFSFAISSANTWTQISITISGDTTGTWLTTNGTGCRVIFSLGSGSGASGAANTWASADYRSATGAVNVVGTNGATFYFTGVQLEVGSSATGFEYRHYGQELRLCQRYYQNIYVNNLVCSRPQGAGTGASQCYVPFLVQTRSTATVAFPQSQYDPSSLGSPTAYTTGSYPAFATNGVRVYSSSNASQNDTGNFTCQMTVSAEL